MSNCPSGEAFQGDSDIAGAGVITAFMVSVSLTFSLVVYGFYFVPHSYPDWMLNGIDRMWIRSVTGMLARFRPAADSKMTKKVFSDVVLIFSDQQLVLGLAMLIVGFSKLATITQYHFAIVSSLAGMSFVVHVASIDIVADDIRHKPEKKWWRAIGILLVAILALLTTMPWLHKEYLENYGEPVRCIWVDIPGNTTAKLGFHVALYTLLCVWGIIVILSMLFPEMMRWPPIRAIIKAIKWMILRPRKAYYASLREASPSTRPRKMLKSIKLHLWHSLAVLLFVITEILWCQGFSLSRNWALLLLNAIDLFELRANTADQDMEGSENDWGFGQAVPVFLLILPLCTIFEVCYDVYYHLPQKSESAPAQGPTECSTMTGTPLSAEPASFVSGHSQPSLPLGEPLSRSTGRMYRGRLDTEAQGSMVHRHSSQTVAATSVYSTNGSLQLSSLPSRAHSTLHLSRSAAASSGLGTNPPPASGNAGHYYFDCSDDLLGSDRFEDDLWKGRKFRILMAWLPVGVFVGVTIAGIYGYAI